MVKNTVTKNDTVPKNQVIPKTNIVDPSEPPMHKARSNWFREAISDEYDRVDIAYIVIGALAVAALAALAFIFTMATIDYFACQPQTTLTKGPEGLTSVVPCRFDPLPIGQAAGLIFAAFAGLIGSLAGYMAATRRREATVRNNSKE